MPWLQREEDFATEQKLSNVPEYDGQAILQVSGCVLVDAAICLKCSGVHADENDGFSQEDSRLDALRYRLVPSKLAEPVFWRRYFALVAQVRKDILGSVVTEHDDLVHVPPNPECSLAGELLPLLKKVVLTAACPVC